MKAKVLMKGFNDATGEEVTISNWMREFVEWWFDFFQKLQKEKGGKGSEEVS